MVNLGDIESTETLVEVDKLLNKLVRIFVRVDPQGALGLELFYRKRDGVMTSGGKGAPTERSGDRAPTTYHDLARTGLDAIAPPAEVARLQAELKEAKP